MDSFNCPACNKRFTTEHFMKRHLEVMHKDYDPSPKAKGWGTPYGFVDFKEPVTYAEALEVSRMISEHFNNGE